MPEADNTPHLDAQQVEAEIRRGRNFSLADLIGQEGGDFLKGDSPVPRLIQVKNEILGFLNAHLSDPEGALQATLREWVSADDIVCSRYFDQPLGALAEMLSTLLAQDVLFYDFVRRVDMQWGQLYGDRPHFQQPGQAPHPDDRYTHAFVRSQLVALLNSLQNLGDEPCA